MNSIVEFVPDNSGHVEISPSTACDYQCGHLIKANPEHTEITVESEEEKIDTPSFKRSFSTFTYNSK